jgi:electron transport complex protein RnfC
VDEALAGHAKRVDIILHADQSLEVIDDGRGMPVDIHPEEGVPAVELILCRLHAGGKFSNKNYQFSGGLHGVGISVVNALSKRVEVNVRRDGQIYNIAFENGEKVQDLQVVGTCGKRNTGTSVHFWPDESFFDSPRFSVSRLTHLLKAKAVLCPGVEITFKDHVNNTEQTWCYADGLNDYLCEAVNGLPTLPEKPFVGNFSAQVVEGIRILAHVLQPREVLIGIEDNKPQAISMLRAVLAGSHDISLRVVPTKYPSGGAKQLTQILTGKQVPHGGRSSDIGVLMQNVGTAYAVKRAVVDGEPLTERVVTLTGESVSRPGNVWARLGTPVRHLLEQAEFCPSAEQMVIMGGPLMGFTLPWLDVPVVKITNCLLAPSASEMGESPEEKGCIRCSACADACPADLLPQQLYWYSKGQLHDKAKAHNLADCIECGACAWVCPSNIPLVQYFRVEKAELYAISMEEKRAAEAKARFEARQARLEREKEARQERHKQAAVQPAAKDQDAIKAALARVREKNANATEDVVIQSGTRPDNSEAIAAREARKAQARARQAEKTAQNDEPVDPRKAAVDAAIARAKARKAEAQEEPAPEPVDPRKAAVDAAIARAKARKAEAQEEPAAEPVDPRKAAVEAAIARAKARKAEAQEETTAEPIDPRKAAVEAAIARAKARKAAQEEEQAANDDPRKAAVSAAIARVQAKKAAQQAVNED